MKEPKIRFKGFTGEWEEKKIGTMTSVRGGYAFQSSLFQKSGIPVVRISNILSNGNVGGDFAYYPRLDGDTNITIHEKDVVIAMSGATTGKIARVDVGDGILYQNQRVGLFTKTGKVDYDFLYAVLNRPHFNELLNKLLTSSAQPNASSADIESIEMGFPEDAEEQKALSNYILSLDSLIQSTTKKIESLKQVKAASLQSMFPQEGETTPRVRFKGFEGEWEETPFSETFDYLKNNSLSRAELSDGGVVMNIHYGDVLIKYGECVDVGKEVKTFVKEEYIAKRLHQSCAIINGDIIFADAAEDNTVGKCSEIIANEDDAIISGLHTIPCRPMKQFATRYLGYYLNSNAYHNQLLPHIQGTKISSISKKAISQTHINSPLDIAEQRAIASYFTNLDRQITLQTQRLEKLKLIKSACLDNMFV